MLGLYSFASGKMGKLPTTDQAPTTTTICYGPGLLVKYTGLIGQGCIGGDGDTDSPETQ